MTVYLFGEGTNFALGVFGLTALAVIGLSLLFYRISDTAKRRRSLGYQQFGRCRRIGRCQKMLSNISFTTRSVL